MTKKKQTEMQLWAWRHNGLRGSIRMARGIVDGAATAPTATDEAQEFAARLAGDLYQLEKLLKERRPHASENPS